MKSMTKEGAERAVVISALIVFGVYFYRHITEKSSIGQATPNSGGVSQLIGLGTPANIGKFVTAWGLVFFVLALAAEAAPGLGGSFAILTAVGDLLANTQQLATDVNAKLGQSNTPSSAAKTPAVVQDRVTLPPDLPVGTQYNQTPITKVTTTK